MQGPGFSVKSIPRTLVAILEAITHARLYRRLSPDFIVVNSSVIPGPMLAGKLCRIPSIVMVRESIRTNTQLFSVIPKKALVKVIERISTFRFAVSGYIASQLNEACTVDYPDVRRDLGGEAVLEDSSDPAPPKSARLRAVMLGSFSPEKGQADAIQAIAIARAAGVNIELSLYGYAHPQEILKMEEWCQRNGIAEWISYRGFTDDPLEAYKTADVSLVCSRNEAYGRVTAESLLIGVPVVGYALGGTTEILKAGGGIPCEPRPEDLANALALLAEHPEMLSDLRSQCKALRGSGSEFGDSARTVSRMVELVRSLKDNCASC
jgi:glycosyltransferase involved in cell wall biosynthesis